jgi:hypothetical protein
MEYHQSGGNPFAGDMVRPFQRALHARAGRNDEFVYPTRENRTRNTVGHHPSLIMQRGVPYHSSYELAAMRYLDVLPCVDCYWPQAKTIYYEFPGDEFDERILRKYTPDLGVRLVDGRMFWVEVKVRSDAESPKNRMRWFWFGPAVERDGQHHTFLLSDFLDKEPLAKNLRLIQQYIAPPFDPEQVDLLKMSVARNPTTPIEAVLRMLPQYGFKDEDLMSLVLYRHLYVDLTEEVTLSSTVLLPTRAPRSPQWSLLNAT